MSISELEALRLAAVRATDLAIAAREDRVRAERTLEVLKVKEYNIAQEASRAAKEYQAAIARTVPQ